MTDQQILWQCPRCGAELLCEPATGDEWLPPDTEIAPINPLCLVCNVEMQPQEC